MAGLIERARQLRIMIEKAAQSLTDEEALDNKELYAFWSGEGVEYAVGIKVRYKENLYSCIQAHTSQKTWMPSKATSLWAKVLIPDPGVIPVWEQPSSTNPYMSGDKVHYPTAEDPVYISIIDNNVWAPDQYGWELWEG